MKPRHIPIREAWLAQRHEAPVDPDQPIIDAHHHLWDKPGSRYLLDDILADLTSGHDVRATVFVEGKEGYLPDGDLALRPLGETQMATAIGEAGDRQTGGRCRVAAGIVGFVDLVLGADAGALLDRHIEAGKGRFRGVRNATAWHADPDARGSVLNHPPGQLYDPEMRRGLAELQCRDLVFDAWLYHSQLGDLVDLADAMPDLQIVVNHIGGPIGIGPYLGRRAQVRADWRHFMTRLAEYPNVTVKLGGLGMLMAGFDFHEQPLPPSSDDLAQAWGPYMRDLIDLFGPQRCMFESNFPVDKGTASYGILWNAFKKIAGEHSPKDRHLLLFGTANRVYRLGM